ncbi:MAG: hypothetical protein NZ874_08365 [Fimbriimonadales bacterium]|nr:hypothetical protein [Fimbriimonadales bacterium]
MRTILLILAVALVWGGLTAQQKSESKPVVTTVAAILKEPDKFHRKFVQVEGEVDDLKKKVSRAGNAYTTFKLESGGRQLTVFSYGHLSIREEDKVIVVGRFYKERRVGRTTFTNEIDASPKSGGSVRVKEKADSAAQNDS